MRLPRPYIPLRVREQVIDRQIKAAGFRSTWSIKYVGSAAVRVKWKLQEFFGEPVELHHRPALVNRPRIKWSGRYVPDANDPDYLVYLPATDHDIETRVRGQHGQHSDLGLARKRKRKERKAKLHEDGRPVWTARQRQGPHPKRKWPSRSLRSASRWPKRKLTKAKLR